MNSTAQHPLETITVPEAKEGLNRLQFLKDEVSQAHESICAERAIFITQYFKDKENKNKPLIIQKAEALAYVLDNKGRENIS